MFPFWNQEKLKAPKKCANHFFYYFCSWIETTLSKTYCSIASQSPPQVKSNN